MQLESNTAAKINVENLLQNSWTQFFKFEKNIDLCQIKWSLSLSSLFEFLREQKFEKKFQGSMPFDIIHPSKKVKTEFAWQPFNLLFTIFWLLCGPRLKEPILL